MHKIGLLLFVITSIISCQSESPVKTENQAKKIKKAGIMEEYHAMKTKLEPQGYVITTDSISKVFIDNSVTINYQDKKKK